MFRKIFKVSENTLRTAVCAVNLLGFLKLTRFLVFRKSDAQLCALKVTVMRGTNLYINCDLINMS